MTSPIRSRLRHYCTAGLSAFVVVVVAMACADDPTSSLNPLARLNTRLDQPMVGYPTSGSANLAVQPINNGLVALAAAFTATPFANEFVVTGAESGDHNYIPSNGDGTFGTRSTIPGLGAVDGMDVADMDGDGDNDFLACDVSGVSLLVNNGSGSFAPSQAATGVSTSFCSNLRIADFNGDGRPDFVVGDGHRSLGMFVYLQDAAGTFSRVTPGLDVSWTNGSTWGVAAGDVDGDGLQDVLVLGYNGTGDGQVRFYKGNGTGAMATSTLLLDAKADFGVTSTVGLALFDLDSDGDLDVVVGGGGLGDHYVYTNDGGGNFAGPGSLAFDVNAQTGIDASDVDGDGDHDLLVAGFGTRKLYLVKNNGGSLAPVQEIADLNGSTVGLGAPPTMRGVRAPSAPTITGITPADQQLSVAFNAPESDGGSPITNYQYSTNNGDTWVAMDPAQTSSPLVITGLINGTEYQVTIRAVNLPGAGAPSNTVAGTPFAQATEVIPPDETETVTVTVHDENGGDAAAVQIPPGTFELATTVTIELSDPVEEGAPCHAYLLGQTGKCLKITAETSPGVPAQLDMDVTVGLCLSASAELDMYKFETPEGAAIVLEEVDFLDCAPSEGASRAPRNWLDALAMGVTKRVVKFVSPKLLYAADRGFGGTVSKEDGFSTFTWASPIHIHQAGVIVSSTKPKDGFVVAGNFNLAAFGIEPFETETGFIPSQHDVTVTFGNSVRSIPAGSFKYSYFLKRWVYARLVTDGITAMTFNAIDGSFTVAGIVPTEGALPMNKQFMVQVGHRMQGALLICGTDHKCVPQHPHGTHTH